MHRINITLICAGFVRDAVGKDVQFQLDAKLTEILNVKRYFIRYCW